MGLGLIFSALWRLDEHNASYIFRQVSAAILSFVVEADGDLDA